MHGMSATHATHSTAKAAVPSSPHHESSDALSVACTDSGCNKAQATVCTPSAKTGSLTALTPGTGVNPWTQEPGAHTSVSARRAYLPVSPSPVELCISRT